MRQFMHEASPGQNMRYSRQHERPYNVGCSTCQCVMFVLSLWLLITLFFCGVPSLFEEGVGDSWIRYANSLFQTLHPVSYAFSVFECFHCSRLAFAVAVACCVAARSRAFHCHAGVASSCCRRPTASGSCPAVAGPYQKPKPKPAVAGGPETAIAVLAVLGVLRLQLRVRRWAFRRESPLAAIMFSI